MNKRSPTECCNGWSSDLREQRDQLPSSIPAGAMLIRTTKRSSSDSGPCARQHAPRNRWDCSWIFRTSSPGAGISRRVRRRASFKHIRFADRFRIVWLDARLRVWSTRLLYGGRNRPNRAHLVHSRLLIFTPMAVSLHRTTPTTIATFLKTRRSIGFVTAAAMVGEQSGCC